jgi:transcriptional adapter 2-alpha
MPGRLEFEHEVENEAEMAVKDLEFGLVWRYGGDQQPESVPAPVFDEDAEEAGGDKSRAEPKKEVKVKVEPEHEGVAIASDEEADVKPDIHVLGGNGAGGEKATSRGEAKEIPPGLEVEDEDELDVKLALLEIYFSKLDKREEAKEIIFDRGLTEHKRVSS